ncbi:MAG: pantoate--beta-alanine ligase [Deltaproteobacteria bacterium]|nr:pantoate--beta-alanine ligase [Deltaproteobacteria bacterium]
METIRRAEKMQRRCLAWRSEGLRIGLVPTMGFFHDGHLALIRQAGKLADRVVVSLFVNPTQFGPGEDLAAYPRDPEKDAVLAAENGADVMFCPDSAEMYAPDHSTWIEVAGVSKHLCGASRPGHFRGVATVVAKLFWICLPHAAVFGEKDWQQLAVIRRMVRDLNIPVEIVGHPIVREADGLAMSSRNAYLSPDEQRLAPYVQTGLVMARELYRKQSLDSAVEIEARLTAYYEKHLPGSRLDYASCVDGSSIEPVDRVDDTTVLAVALFLGRTRLIDNIRFGEDR